MRTTRLLLTLTFLLAAFVQLQAAALQQKHLIGKWQYSAPTAPPNYSTGQINFIQDGEKLKGELVIEGQKVEFSQIIIKGEEVAVTIYLESTPITIKFKIVDGKLEGSADTPDGLVAVVAVRK
ncbi:MAG TPA: hypothetical protein VN249_09765 [Prolixibacteraceae bacterium]|nr:hypothetical protein [Prolixibacteraceae bacterium]